MKREGILLCAVLLMALALASCETEPSPLYGKWVDSRGISFTFNKDNTFSASIESRQYKGSYTVLLNVISMSNVSVFSPNPGAAATITESNTRSIARSEEEGEGEPGEGQPGGGEPGEGQPGEGQPGEGEPGEGQPGEGEPGEGQPGEGEPGEGQPGEGEPGEGQPGEGQPGEGEGPPAGGDEWVSVNDIVSEWDIRGNILYLNWTDVDGSLRSLTLFKVAN